MNEQRVQDLGCEGAGPPTGGAGGSGHTRAEGEDDLDFDGGGGGNATHESDENFTLRPGAEHQDKSSPPPATVKATTAPLANVPPANATDPVIREPYRWSDCTVTISIQLLPERAGEPRKGYIGIRTHLDAPLISAVTAADLHPLPRCVEELIARMKEELPARAELYLERERKAAEKNKSSAKGTPKHAHLKPGRYTAEAANLFARADVEGRAPAERELPDAGAPDDDIFGYLLPDDTGVTGDADGGVATAAARKTPTASASVKKRRAGGKHRANRGAEAPPPARTNQGSLLG